MCRGITGRCWDVRQEPPCAREGQGRARKVVSFCFRNKESGFGDPEGDPMPCLWLCLKCQVGLFCCHFFTQYYEFLLKFSFRL